MLTKKQKAERVRRDEDRAARVFAKWDLDFAVVGRVTDTKRMVLTSKGGTVADMPITPLAEGVQYDRPWETPPAPPLIP